jgi:hypothetical protein
MDFDKILKERVQTKQYRVIFSKILEKEPEDNREESLNYILKGYDDYIANKNLMKNNNIILENYFKNEHQLSDFEFFNDHVQKTIIDNKAKKLKKRIISNKYNHLCNNNTHKLFREMAQMEFTKQELQDYVGKKISAFHHPEELNGALMNLIDLKSLKDIPSLQVRMYKKELEEGIDYDLKTVGNKAFVNIYTPKAAESLGSRMWCITREKRMYDYYKELQYTDYQFVYDFDRSPAEEESMIALLNDASGVPFEIFTKSDTEILKNTKTEYHEFAKKLKEEAKGLIKEEDLKVSNMIRKTLRYKHKINDQKALDIGEEYFNPNDDYHLLAFIEANGFNSVIEKEDVERNPDVFGTYTIDEDINLFKTKAASKYLEMKYEYTDDFEKAMKDNVFSNEELFYILTNENFKDLKKYTAGRIVKHFLDNKEFDLVDDFFLNHDNSLITNYHGNYNDRGLTLASLILIEDYVDHLIEKDLLNQIISEEERNNKDLRNNLIIKTNTAEELEPILKVIPDLKDYKVDMEELDYMKTFYIKEMGKKDNKMISHYDFNNDGTKAGCFKIFSDILSEKLNYDPNSYISSDFKVNRANLEEELKLIQYIDEISKNRIKFVDELKKEQSEQTINQKEELQGDNLLELLENMKKRNDNTNLNQDSKNRVHYITNSNPVTSIGTGSVASFISSINLVAINERLEFEAGNRETKNIDEKEKLLKYIDESMDAFESKTTYIKEIIKRTNVKLNMKHAFQHEIARISRFQSDETYHFNKNFHKEIKKYLKGFEDLSCFDFERDFSRLEEKDKSNPFWRAVGDILEDKNKIDNTKRLR